MENKKVRIEPVEAPMLFPIELEQYWQMLRMLVREEVIKLLQKPATNVAYDTPGLIYKPLFKMEEVCKLFQVTKPTIYDWIRYGKLKPYKIRSRVYFLWNDIQKLLQPNNQEED
ncbi:helix-turn-helix domain-containing protein [Chitinophaga polysaccharea]|uniref:helix-turn-helix domain-containing protein n=1 Tax=Chitinophaga polysaccharea TaxID=1293035 RepID=UPI00145569F0|nr:helix-turn-helix domain-containing protein [Chitinophaga polysaccharea]NLR56926.1 helix-turn-helix domain-containing protein [Chitinophaga polysaccharea]